MKRIFTLFISLTLFSWVSQAQPSTQATNVVFTQGSATSLNISWTTGNGTNKLVVISSGGGVFTPVNTTNYTADTNSDFALATDKDGGSGVAKIVYGGTANTITVSNLPVASFLTVRVYEFTLTGFLYNVTTASNNPMEAWFANANTSYTVPAGVTSITVQAWGGGGAGGGPGSGSNARAGGGGGAFVRGTITTTPATVYPVVIGAGGPAQTNSGLATTFGGAGLFSADFGTGGAGSGDTPGVGGLASASVVTGTATGVTKTNGSNGANRSNPDGGAGGDAGNTTGTGGAGGIGASNSGGFPGKVAGGGGGGADDDAASTGGAGGNGFVIVSNVPLSGTLTPTGPLSGLSTTYGTASSFTTFTLTGASLGAGASVLITPPAGFEVADGTLLVYGSTLSYTADGSGALASKTVNVRLAASSTPASYSGNVSITSALAPSATIATVSSTVNQKNLTITGIGASNKVYDRLNTATVTGSPTLVGIVGADVVNTSGSTPAGTFASVTVNTGINVTFSGYVLGGANAANYTLSQPPTVTADITAKNLTITGVVANNKPFDGTNTATLDNTSAALVGVISPDVVTINTGGVSATFASTAVGNGIVVTAVGYALSGGDAGNYTVSQPTGLTANITALTTVAQVSGGVAAGPTVNTSAGTVALLGFSLNNASNTSDLTSLTLTTTANPTTLFSSISLVSSADNTYDGADPAVSATLGTTPTSISFTGITGQTITSGGTFYYFLKVTLNPFFPTVDPTIKISFDPTSAISFTGGVAGQGSVINTINGANSSYTLHDNIAPTITSITNNVNPVYQSALVQTVVVVFSETMKNTGFNPAIALSAGTWGGQATVGWTTTTFTDDTYTATFTHGASPEETISGITAGISTMTAQDISSNTVSNTLTSAGNFLLDNQRPTVTVTRNAVTLGSFTGTTDNSVSFNIDFNEPLAPGTFTTADITVNAGGTTASSGNILSGGNNQNFVYTINNITGDGLITLSFGTAYTDVVGNAPVAFGPSAGFQIDNTPPTVAITLVSGTPSTLSTLHFTVTVNEPVNSVDAGDFAINLGGTSTVSAATLGIVSGASPTYDVEVTGIIGQTTDILNLDFAVSPTITDDAGNAFIIAGITGEQEYVVDNTKPVVSLNEFTLNPNGASAETITFTMSETLNLADLAIVNGFSVSTGTLAAGGAIYTLSTNTITLTNSGADGTWAAGTTVTYTAAGGNVADVIGNTMSNISATPVTIQVVDLVAGDIAFVGYNSNPLDGFSFLLLKNIAAGTIIKFTDNGWTGSALTTDETTITWTAPAGGLQAGTEVTIIEAVDNVLTTSHGTSMTAGLTNLDLSTDDQIIAYQGASGSPTFISGIHVSDDNTEDATTLWNTAAAAAGGDNNRSALPTGLTNGTNALSFSPDEKENARYKTSVVTLTGSAQQLRASINTYTNWDNQDATNYTLTAGVNKFPIRPVITAVSIPNVTMKIGSIVTATLTVHDDRGAFHNTLSGNIDNFSLGSLVRVNATTYSGQFTVTEGGTNVLAANDIPTSISLTSAQGNTITSVATPNTPAPYTTPISQAADAIDANSPKVLSINRQSATNPWSATFGTSASSVIFRITFSEDMQSGTLTAADFSMPVTGSVTGAAVTGIATITGTSVFDVTVGSYTGTGTLGLNYRDSEVNITGASVLDVAGNPTFTSIGVPDGSFTGQTYAIVLPTPSNEAFTLNTPSITGNSVTLTWNSTNTAQIPTHFLVLGKLSTDPAFTNPPDGTVVSDGPLAQNVVRVSGTNTWTFSGLSSGTSYDFRVYKYTLSANNTSDNIDFEITAPGVNDGVVTPTAPLSSMILTSSAVPISSLMDNNGNSASVLQFKIYDDGQDPISPNVMTLHPNGSSQETITFTLREALTLPNGAAVTGFSSSSPSVVSATYTTVGNTITLTSAANGNWNSGTTISYNSAIGNAQFVTLGKMQSIDAHPVAQASDVTQTFNSSGTFNVPAGVTSVTVEVWGGGGSGGGYSGGISNRGGGGGGGAYSRRLVTVVPGSPYNVTVGLGATCCSGDGQPGGASSFGGTLVTAGGGGGGIAGDSGSFGGAGGSPGIGDVSYPGGAGATGASGTGIGGGGGSSAGTSAFGNPGDIFGGPGIAPPGGGNGGAGVSAGSAGNGIFPGGGGGGTGTPGTGSFGANGRVIVTYSNPIGGGSSDWVADNAPFKFSDLIITQGVGNSAALSDWRDIIAGAELYDGINPTPHVGVVNPTDGSDITFSGIASTVNTDIGFIDDAVGTASSKTYTLKVWLKNNLTSTLAAQVDGLNLAFQADPANLTYDDTSNGNQISSRLVATQPALESGSNAIDVVATQLDFSTNPNPTQLVLQPIASTSAAPDLSTSPVVRARDVNGNTDKNFGGVNAITLSSAITLLPTTATMTNGVAILSAPQYQDSGNGTLTASTAVLATNGLAPGAGISSAVTVNYSTTTTLQSGVSVATISSLKTTTPYFQVYDFNLVEDNGAGGDGSPTRFTDVVITKGVGDDFTDWSEAIAGALFFDGSTYVFGTIGTNTLTFNGIDPTALGFVADNATKNYKIWLLLNASMGGTLPDDVDNKNFVFRVQDLNFTLSPLSSLFTGAEDLTSDPTKIAVNVVATKLQFSTNPASVLLVGKDISLQPPVPLVEALDVNNNRDLDYTSTNVTTTNDGGLTMSNLPANGSIINGLLTFPSNFQFNTSGTPIILNVASTGPSIVSNASSTSFTVRAGVASTITAGALSEPAFISSIADDNNVVNPPSGGTDVFDFVINDDPGGTPANEDDGNPTRIQSITITQGAGNAIELTDWTESIGSAQISDGTNTLFGVVNASSIVFAGIPNVNPTDLGHIIDDANKTYTLKIWLKEMLGGTLPLTIDGKSFQFEVTAPNISTDANGTSIIGTELENSGTANEVEVTASQLDYTTQPTSASVNVDLIPQIEVSARDANGNLDSDFTGSITATGNNPIDPGPFATTNDPTGAFAGGLKSYPSNFQFSLGNGDVELTIDAGGISGTSSIISLVTSFDSWVYFDPSYAYTPKIDFANKQEAVVTGTSQALARIILSDGGSATSLASPTNPSPGAPNQAMHEDIDGSFTGIDDFTISLSNFQDIRKIALFETDGVTKIGSDITPAATVTFTGLSSYTAPDNGTYQFYIRASFEEVVTDLDQIAMQVTAVTQSAGSKFAEQQPIAPPPTVAGVDGAGAFGDSSPLNILGVPINLLDVIATSLDFTTQGSTYAGTNEPIGPTYAAPGLSPTSAGIVEARDIFTNLDTDFNPPASSIAITYAGGSVASPAGFTNGILNLDGMLYTNVGDGTLTVQANGIDSSNPPIANTSAIPGQLVNVVNVTATLATNGVLTSPNIKGGAINQVIFGVTFTPDNNSQTNAEPSLSKFIFTFDKPYEKPGVQILKNFDVKESNVGSFAGSTTVTLSLATITKGASAATALLGPGNYDQVIVDWGANPPRELFNPSTSSAVPLSYFLVADVDPTANISTPTLTPSVTDAGFGSSTDVNIITTKGTAIAQGGSVVGNTYQFASTRPPVLIASSSVPFSGQLNVDPATTSIFLRFDVEVVSLDGTAELFNRATNTKVADLVAVPTANYTVSSDLTATDNPIEFTINFLGTLSFQPDSVYYVTIKKGTFDNVNLIGQGISDSGLNYYGGISSNGTYYFKISSQNPPSLTLAQGSFSNTSIGTFKTTFDQAGKAHYLVLTTGSPTPITSEILNPGTYGTPANIRASGNYTINQINTPQTVTFSAALALSTTYDVWIFARNDAQPTPQPVTGPPYGAYSSTPGNHPIGAAGPTFKFTVPPVAPNNFAPAYLVCPDSFVNLSSPIVLGETNNGDFASVSVQDFYILLPTGFEFDGVNKPNVILNGSDFGGPAIVDFINNTLVHVTFTNNGATSKDNIIITDLRVKGISGSNPGSIRKFAGTNMLGSNPNLASISVFPIADQKFINSYADQNSFVSLTPAGSKAVTSIPDNYIDLNPQIIGSVRLLPQITPANDYGASFFSGTGITDDKLTMSAVSLNSAFDVTMIHTDPNGCRSETNVQYLVYDHRSPISAELGSSYLPPSPLAGTQQALVNPNFPSSANAPTFTFGPVSPSGPTRINSDDLAGYKLIQLNAALPADTMQIMKASTGWTPVVNSIPVEVHSVPTTNIPGSAVDPSSYRDYQWNYSNVLNAKLDGFVTTDPYDNFKKANGTPIGNTYWEGGSLGKVEFTGLFQSTADFQVLVPFRQEVELFVPAIPLLEIGSGNVASYNEPDATLNTIDMLTPSQHIKSILYTNTNGYPGTAIFCEASGLITVNGYPAASAGFSTGTFTAWDYKSYDFANNTGTSLLPAPPSTAFVDNGNGTATLDPTNSLLRNNYEDILVRYVFKENNSPAIGTGFLVIRVAPNPLADFTQISLSNPNVSPLVPTAYCEGRQIEFDGTLSGFGSNGAGGTTITEYSWNFGDNINSIPATNPNTVSGAGTDPSDGGGTVEKPYHTFLQSAPYNVSLSATTDVGCSTTSPTIATINVGGIPSVAFGFEGVSIADPMLFTDNSNVTSGGGISDGINQIDWDFGVGQTPQTITSGFATQVVNNYGAAGPYDVTETVTSLIGCVSNTSKTIVMLEKFVADDANPYMENFEANNGNWQVLKNPAFTGTASWAWGTPTTSVITNPLNGNNIWTTNLSSSYSPEEISYLYTSCFDLLQLARPMISFNSMVQLGGVDGVVLEYSTDNLNITDPNKVWELLGNYANSVSTGVDWYNALGLNSKPGDQTTGDYGWNGTSKTSWLESKHILDQLDDPKIPNGPLTLVNNVVFRFALASLNKLPTNDGFAIDNIRIGNRTRTVLVENFTNKANTIISNVPDALGMRAEKYESDSLKNFNPGGTGTKLVKINYHVGFPKIDPFNLDNPADPSARALYYNVTETPRGRLDGFKNPGNNDAYFSTWSYTQYGIRTLQLAQADLVLSTAINADNGLQVDVQVIARIALPADTRLRVAILEKDIAIAALASKGKDNMIATGESDFEYVLKKMLPSAIGTPLNTVLLPTDAPLSFTFNWYPDKSKLYDSPDDLAVVAFLQNDITKEILQSEILEPIADPPLVTGLDFENFIDRIGIYPNPADQEIKIVLPSATPKPIQIQMVDQMGRVVNRSILDAGKVDKDIDTRDLAAGVYMVLFEAGDTSVFKKVMIVHRN